MFVLFVVLGLAMTGCSSKTSETTKTEEGKVVVEFWHSLDGDNGQTLDGIIKHFNEQSDSVEVKASFQDNVQQQMRTVGKTNSAPVVFMGQGRETAYYSQSDYVTSIEALMEEDSEFDISSLNEAVVENHSIDGKLNSMPFNVSVQLMFYNADLFEQAGLDPNDPPQTFGEIQADAETLTTGENMKGFSIPLDSSFITNFFAVQDELMYNNDNGRSGEAPTETYLNSPVGKEIYNWISDMNEAGTFGNYGRTWSNTQLAFSSGELAMYLDSSAVTGIWLDTLDFKLKAAPFPIPDDVEWVGENQGGSELWLSNQATEEEQEAGWEFIKFMVSPEVQSEWAASTGYVPVTPESAEISPLKEAYNENEQLKVGYDVLQETEPSDATAGPSIEQLEVTEQIAQSLENLVQGDKVENVLNDVEEKINDLLQE
nr:ABC transporter substrate-binding protein [Virgibacillus halotolerans]